MKNFWLISSYRNKLMGYAQQFFSFQVCKMVGCQGLNRHATIAVTIIFLFGIFIAFCTTTMKGGSMEPELKVFPQQVLIGDPISIAVRGLSAGQNVSLNVNGKDQFGNTWSSNASFRADGAGTVDMCPFLSIWPLNIIYQGQLFLFIKASDSYFIKATSFSYFTISGIFI